MHLKFVGSEQETYLFWVCFEIDAWVRLASEMCLFLCSEGAQTNGPAATGCKRPSGSIVKEGFADTDHDDDDNKYADDSVHEHEDGNEHEDEDVR